MASRDSVWSRIIPSVALSLAAAVLLFWHVGFDPTKKVDGWAITLLVVVFLPWLGAIFETIEFPGGGKVEWRKRIEDEQERQARDIEALQFLLARFITEGERDILRRLATGDSIPSERNDGGKQMERTRSLHRLGMVTPKSSAVDARNRGDSVDYATLNESYDVSVSGQKYLDLIATLPDIDETIVDPYRPA